MLWAGLRVISSIVAAFASTLHPFLELEQRLSLIHI